MAGLRESFRDPSTLKPKVWKSLRQTRNYEEKGYSFLYNLGTLGSVTPISTSNIRNMGYESLQRYNDFRRLSGENRFTGITSRKLVYSIGGRMLSSGMSRMLPRVGGLTGRLLRASAGRASQKILSHYDKKTKDFLRGTFSLDADAVDKKIKQHAMRGRFNVTKVQLAIAAIASANAPDYYALARKNTGIGSGDKYHSGMVMQNHSLEDVEQMMSSYDMAMYMENVELPDRDLSHLIRTGTGVGEAQVMDTYRMKGGDGHILESKPKGFKSIGAAELYLRANPTRAEDYRDAVRRGQAKDKSTPWSRAEHNPRYGEGALYRFGDKSIDEDKRKAIANMAADYLGLAEVDGLPTGGDQLANTYSKLLELHAQGVPIEQLGQGAQTARIIRGDLADTRGPQRYRKVNNEAFNPALPESKENPRRKWEQGPRGQFHSGGGENEHQSLFTDNIKRHNFVPNQEQIRKSIHMLDPVDSDKDGLVMWYVLFGGRNANDRKATGVRDALAIELGGPATDKTGGRYYRTDQYVYTPTLLMYRAMSNAAKAFGIDKPTKKPDMVSSMGGMIIPTTNPNFNARTRATQGGRPLPYSKGSLVRAKGMTTPADTKRAMEQVYRYSSLANTKVVTDQGRAVLSKRKMLLDSHDAQHLELIDNVLNDAIFTGAQPKLQDWQQAAPFEKKFRDVIKPTSSAEELTKELNFYGFQEQQRMSAAGGMFANQDHWSDANAGKLIKNPPTDGSVIFKTLTDDNGTEFHVILGEKVHGKAANYVSTKGSVTGIYGDNELNAADIQFLREPVPGTKAFDAVPIRQLTKIGVSLQVDAMEREILVKMKAILRQGGTGLAELEIDQACRTWVLTLRNRFKAAANEDLSVVDAMDSLIPKAGTSSALGEVNRTLKGTGIIVEEAGAMAFSAAAEGGLAALANTVRQVKKTWPVDDINKRAASAQEVAKHLNDRPPHPSMDPTIANANRRAAETFSQGDLFSFILHHGTGSITPDEALIKRLSKEFNDAIKAGKSPGDLQRLKEKMSGVIEMHLYQKAVDLGLHGESFEQNVVSGHSRDRNMPGTVLGDLTTTSGVAGIEYRGRTGAKPKSPLYSGKGHLALSTTAVKDINDYKLNWKTEGLTKQEYIKNCVAYCQREVAKMQATDGAHTKNVRDKVITAPIISQAWTDGLKALGHGEHKTQADLMRVIDFLAAGVSQQSADEFNYQDSEWEFENPDLYE